jgi:hypothetical protein
MMDITPIWIDGYYDTQAEAADAMQTMLRGIALEPVPTPALTLDQIEEWLEGQRPVWSGYSDEYDSYVHMSNLVTDLLAQVRAWKEGT